MRLIQSDEKERVRHLECYFITVMYGTLLCHTIPTSADWFVTHFMGMAYKNFSAKSDFFSDVSEQIWIWFWMRTILHRFDLEGI